MTGEDLMEIRENNQSGEKYGKNREKSKLKYSCF